MPTRDWNGKFHMAGCGGLCGSLPNDEPGFMNYSATALSRGYAVAVTDTGHWGGNAIDARWAYENIQAREDYAYRAVHEVARVSKAIIKRFYGKKIEHAYFEGCSNGGRQALMEAQRYPTDFDGIIAAAPVTDITGFIAQYVWNIQSNTNAQGQAIFNPAKVNFLGNAVKQACADEDGLIGDPRQCQFDPATLQCQPEVSNPKKPLNCFSPAEVAMLRKWYAGPQSSDGRKLHIEGVPLGSESSWQGAVGKTSLWRLLMEAYTRYLIFDPAPGPDYDVLAFNLDKDLPKIKRMADMLGPTDPDLSGFKANGGKLIIYSGWADPYATPLTPIAYYDAVEKTFGGRKATQDVTRLFMVPGMNHCGYPDPNSPGIDARGIDPLTALEQWVEQGSAPNKILTTKFDQNEKIKWQRPVCAYPKQAV